MKRQDKIAAACIVAVVIVLAAVSVWLSSRPTHHKLKFPADLPKSAQPLYGALREPTPQERLAIRTAYSMQAGSPEALKHIFVATKDVKTVAVDQPMIILLPREALDPFKVTKWLGGPLGMITLMFQGVNADPHHPGGELNAILDSWYHDDPICQMVATGIATWNTCLDLGNRKSASPAAMQAHLQPLAPGTLASPTESNGTLQVKPHDSVVLSPLRPKDGQRAIVVPQGSYIAGGQLGLGTLLAVKDGAVAGAYIDPLCVTFSSQAAASRLMWVDMFLPRSVIDDYQRTCGP